jgi:RNA 2',3'-cyclic 3'-phosphodiesterase
VDEYAAVWERFATERRLEFGGHRDPNWRGGHALSASFIVPVQTAQFRDRLERLRNALRPFPFVSLHPDNFMHITLLLLGFLAPKPEERGEISPERLEQIELATRRVLEGFPAFPAELANLNAFPGAVFVEVHDRGMLKDLRSAICAGCQLEEPSGPPHLTLAYFQVPDGTPTPEALISTIERYREWLLGEIQVDRVRLTLLELRSEYPDPETLAEIPLSGERASSANSSA